MNPKNLSFLLNQFDSSVIHDDVKLLWLKLADSFQTRLTVLQYILDTSPHLSKDACEIILSLDYIPEDAYRDLINEGVMTAQELLVTIHNRVIKGTVKEYHKTQIPLKICLEKGADLMVPHPTTGEPMVFLLPKINDYLCQEITTWLETKEDVLKIVNKEGLTLLQAVQKKLLEDGRDNGLLVRLTQMYNKAIQQNSSQNNSDLYLLQKSFYKDQSYSPFVDYFGPTTFFPYNALYILRASESIEWAHQLQEATTPEQAKDLVAICPHPEILQCFDGKLSSLQVHDRFSKQSELTAERKKWVEAVKLSLSDKHELQRLLTQAPSANLRHVLYLLLDEKHVDILPAVLQRLYPTKKVFMEDDRILIDTTENISHPALYAIQQKGNVNVIQCFRTFLGDENLPQFIFNLTSYQRSLLDGVLSENDLHNLYDAVPTLFTESTLDGEDMFTSSLSDQDIPLSLKRRIVNDHAPRLKILETQHSGTPYFWHLLFSGEQNFPLIKELVEKDTSLLLLKSLEGLTIQKLLDVFPKGNSQVRYVKRLFSMGNVDMVPEVLPAHTIVHSFREIWKSLKGQKIHLWSDIDEVLIFDRHFWRYDSFKELIPFELRTNLGEYDHALLDEEAPGIFEDILKNNGRISGLTARPPEEAKFVSTHRRLTQSGYKFAGMQGMESIFTKEKFPHFDQDIFFCGSRDKGEIALEAIETLYGKTAMEDLPIFVFPDDLIENLVSVFDSLKSTRYKFALYHFRAIDRKLAPYFGNRELLLSAISEFQASNKALL